MERLTWNMSGTVTGSTFLDFVLFGAVAGGAVQVVASMMGGKVPGNGIVLACGGGGILGAMLYVLVTGLG